MSWCRFAWEVMWCEGHLVPYVKLVIHHLKMSSWNRRENERESNYIKNKNKNKNKKNKGRKKQFVEKEK